MIALIPPKMENLIRMLDITRSSFKLFLDSDVKRGQNLEAEANFWRLRPRPRPKIIMKKVPNND